MKFLGKPKGKPRNLKGNPHIRTIRKTGPKTDEGKLKSLLSCVKLKRETPLLKRMRVCDKCPLGEKTQVIRVNDKTITRTKPAECSYYEKGRTECVVSVKEWADKARLLYEVERQGGPLELQKAAILEAFHNATTAKEIETIKKGHPGFYSKEWTEIGLKYLTEYNKIMTNQASNKHLHLHDHHEKGDIAERIINKVFPGKRKAVRSEEAEDDDGDTY